MKNTNITIIGSNDLQEMKLTALDGKTGVIVEELTNEGRKNKGFMVRLDEPYLSEEIWFIPFQSVKMN